MKIEFNALGAVSDIITNDEPLRQGNVGANTLTAVFEGKSNLSYNATFNYTRSDDGRLKDIPLTPTANAGEYYYKFSNPWFFALYGETTLTVYLKNSANEIVASGQITFPIEQTDFDTDTNITYTEYQALLDSLAIRQIEYDPNNVRGYSTLEFATNDLPNLADGQIIIVKGTPTEIYQVQAGELVDLIVNKATSDSLGNVLKDSYVSAVYPTYNNTTDKLFIETYSVEDVLMANNEVILPKATTTKNGLMAKEDKVKVDALATTYETIVNSNAKVVETIGGVSSNFSLIINNAINRVLSKTEYLFSGVNIPIYILKYASPTGYALVIKSGSIDLYNGTQGGTWTKVSTFATEKFVTDSYQPTSQKGQPSGYASLDSGGKVPSTQLPSYVDDVLEYANLASFPATGSASVIYVALDTNLTYRWSGSAYVEISPSLALGETAETAYRGDRGKTAYDHSQVVSGNPHQVTKSDVGLGNVDNTSDEDKPISTATQAELDDKAPIVSPSFLGTATITRTEADATTALSVEKSSESATGNIAEFKFAGVKVGQLDKTGMFSGGVEQIVANKNKYLPLLGRSSDGAVIARFGTATWNGSAWAADNASYGFGAYSLQNNTGISNNGFGAYSLYNNTGVNSSGFGTYSLYNNTGAYSNGIGAYSLQNNTGISNNGFGAYSLYNNTGVNSSGFGAYSLYNNTGAYNNGFGYNSLRNNQKANNTAVGHNAYGDVFLTNVDGAKTFDYTAIDITLERATIVAHGFGATNEMVNVKYTATTGTAIGGIALDTIFQIKIIDADTIEFYNGGIKRNITSQGTGTHTFTPQFAYTNTTSLGANTVPNKDNQVVLGNTAVDTIKMGGTFRTPASSTDTGVKGEWCYDANYIYVCIATNEWKRTAITTW